MGLRGEDQLITIRIQHHPGRESVQRLLDQLPPEVEVVEDTGEVLDPWRGYRRCLSDLPETGHVCILQDDVIVARNFVPSLEMIAAANPETIVSLFLSKAPKRTFNLASLKYGKTRYVYTHPQDLVHVVGLLWPVQKARDFLAWVDENPKRLRGHTFSSDDATVTRWMRFSGERIRVTVPSIVEHPDDVASVVNQSKMRSGMDGMRTAAYWIGDADPLELDWSR